MNRFCIAAFFPIAFLVSALLVSTPAAFGQNYLVAPAAPGGSIFPAPLSIDDSARASAPSRQPWELSLIPLFAAQGLDAASSWGHRETNPLLAGPDGSFGMKAAGIKVGFVAGAAVAEYLLMKHRPGLAKLLVRLNYGNAIMTTGFAVHNFVILH